MLTTKKERAVLRSSASSRYPSPCTLRLLDDIDELRRMLRDVVYGSWETVDEADAAARKILND